MPENVCICFFLYVKYDLCYVPPDFDCLNRLKTSMHLLHNVASWTQWRPVMRQWLGLGCWYEYC